MQTDIQTSTAGTITIAEPGKYLTFEVLGENFGLGILKVQEIIGVMPITRIPRMPDFVRGIINLRGRIIPVMDVRRKFTFEAQDDTERTCIVVVEADARAGHMTMGLLVDEVSEVINVLESQIEPAPAFGAQVDTEYILGIAKVGGKVVLLLDVDKLLTEHEADMVGEVTEQV